MKVEDVEDKFRYKCDNCDELFTDLQDKNNHCAMKNCSYPNRIPNNFDTIVNNIKEESLDIENNVTTKTQIAPISQILPMSPVSPNSPMSQILPKSEISPISQVPENFTKTIQDQNNLNNVKKEGTTNTYHSILHSVYDSTYSKTEFSQMSSVIYQNSLKSQPTQLQLIGPYCNECRSVFVCSQKNHDCNMRSSCVKNHINEVHTKWDPIRQMPISQISPNSPQISRNSPPISALNPHQLKQIVQVQAKDRHIPLAILSKLNGKSCTVCGITLQKRYDTIRHIRNVHFKTDKWQCNKCEYRNEKMALLQNHYDTCHKTDSVSLSQVSPSNIVTTVTLPMTPIPINLVTNVKKEPNNFVLNQSDKSVTTVTLPMTPIPRNILPNVVKGEPMVTNNFVTKLEVSQYPKRVNRCHECEGCKQPNCGVCVYCKDRTGPNKLRQACKERICQKKISGNRSVTTVTLPLQPQMTEYICHICDKMTIDAKTLVSHMEECHKQDLTRFVTNAIHDHTYAVSMSGVTKNLSQCQKCDEYFKHEFPLLLHYEYEHDMTEKEIENNIVTNMLKCDKCNFVTRRYTIFKTHVKKGHYSEEEEEDMDEENTNLVYKCDKCEFVGYNTDSLLRHKIKIHQLISGQEEMAGKFKCNYDQCEKEFGLKRNLERHLRASHEGQKDWECHMCNQKFGEKQTLQRHIVNKHRGLAEILCEHCDQKFIDQYTHHKHLEVVHKDFENYWLKSYYKKINVPSDDVVLPKNSAWEYIEQNDANENLAEKYVTSNVTNVNSNVPNNVTNYPSNVTKVVTNVNSNMTNYPSNVTNIVTKASKDENITESRRDNFVQNIHQEPKILYEEPKLRKNDVDEGQRIIVSNYQVSIDTNSFFVKKDIQNNSTIVTKNKDHHVTEVPSNISNVTSSVTNITNRGKIEKDQKVEEYPCDRCEAKLSSQTKLKIHKIFHESSTKTTVANIEKNSSIKQDISCVICGLKFSYNYHFLKHRREVHGKISNLNFLCSECQTDFDSHAELENHINSGIHDNDASTTMKEVAPILKTKAPPVVVAKSLSQPNIQENQIENSQNISTTNYPKSQNGSRKIDILSDIHIPWQILNKLDGKICTLCGYSGLRRFDTIRHIRNIHLNTNLYQCNECDYAVEKMFLLKNHYETDHMNDEETNVITDMKNATSNVTNATSNVTNVTSNMTNVTSNMKITCPDDRDDPFTLLDQNNVKSSSELKQRRPSILRRRVVPYSIKAPTHENNKIIGTNLPTTSISNDSTFEDHEGQSPSEISDPMEEDSSENSTDPLDLSGFIGTSESTSEENVTEMSQMSHVMTEEKSQILQCYKEMFEKFCHECNKEFSTRQCFKNHERDVHQREYIYKCDKCGSDFNSTSNLERHIKLVHQSKINWTCHICDIGFPGKTLFNRHVQAEHLNPILNQPQQSKTQSPGLVGTSSEENVTEMSQMTDEKPKMSHVMTEEKSQMLQCYKEMFEKFCHECKKEFTTRQSFKNHEKVVHQREYIYKCDKCGSAFNSTSNLERHIKLVHQSEINWTCHICDICFHGKILFNKHVQTTHLQKPIPNPILNQIQQSKTPSEKLEKKIYSKIEKNCHICDFTTISLDILQKHVQTEHKGSIISCQVCHEVFLEQYSYHAHTKSVCCKQVFSCAYNYKLHVKKVHEGQHEKQKETEKFLINDQEISTSQISPKLPQMSPETSQIPVQIDQNTKSQLCCYICQPKKHFKISGKLRTHFSKVHDTTAQKRNIKCTKCGFVATKFEFMNDHIKQNHYLDYDKNEDSTENIDNKMSNLNGKCDKCDIKFQNFHSLKNHVRLHHERKMIYKCEKCDYGATRPSNLERHIKWVHERQYNFKCDFCGKKNMGSKDCLLKHMRRYHPDAPKKKCENCEVTYLESYTYDNHLCGSKKRWYCCRKYFRNSMRLELHKKKVHEGSKQNNKNQPQQQHWLCHICDNDNEFPTKNDLQFHMKSKHEGMLIPCELCDDQEFLEQYTYQTHINETHKEFTDFKLFVEPKIKEEEELFEDDDEDMDYDDTDSNFDDESMEEEPSSNNTEEALDNNEGDDDDIIKISNEDIENYDLKTNLEDNVTNNVTENLEDSGNCSNTSDDNDYDDEVTNEFENLIARATEHVENYDLKTNLEDNVTNNVTENLEDSGNCSNTSDDNNCDDMEVTNEFENLIARATELITSSSTLSPLDKVKDNALENDFIMD